MRMSAFLGFLYVYIGWNRYVFGIIEGALWPWLNSLVWRGVVWCGSSLNSLGETRRVKKSFCFLGTNALNPLLCTMRLDRFVFFQNLTRKFPRRVCVYIRIWLIEEGRSSSWQLHPAPPVVDLQEEDKELLCAHQLNYYLHHHYSPPNN